MNQRFNDEIEQKGYSLINGNLYMDAISVCKWIYYSFDESSIITEEFAQAWLIKIKELCLDGRIEAIDRKTQVRLKKRFKPDSLFIADKIKPVIEHDTEYPLSNPIRCLNNVVELMSTPTGNMSFDVVKLLAQEEKPETKQDIISRQDYKPLITPKADIKDALFNDAKAESVKTMLRMALTFHDDNNFYPDGRTLFDLSKQQTHSHKDWESFKKAYVRYFAEELPDKSDKSDISDTCN